jgi:hypothetical protein
MGGRVTRSRRQKTRMLQTSRRPQEPLQLTPQHQLRMRRQPLLHKIRYATTVCCVARARYLLSQCVPSLISVLAAGLESANFAAICRGIPGNFDQPNVVTGIQPVLGISGRADGRSSARDCFCGIRFGAICHYSTERAEQLPNSTWIQSCHLLRQNVTSWGLIDTSGITCQVFQFCNDCTGCQYA